MLSINHNAFHCPLWNCNMKNKFYGADSTERDSTDTYFYLYIFWKLNHMHTMHTRNWNSHIRAKLFVSVNFDAIWFCFVSFRFVSKHNLIGILQWKSVSIKALNFSLSITYQSRAMLWSLVVLCLLPPLSSKRLSQHCKNNRMTMQKKWKYMYLNFSGKANKTNLLIVFGFGGIKIAHKTKLMIADHIETCKNWP